MSEATATPTAEATAETAAPKKTAPKKKAVKATVTAVPGGAGKTVTKKPAAAKKTATGKATATKEAPKKTAKKKTAKKVETATRAKKEGLRKPQLRVLQALGKANKPLTRVQIAEKAPVDQAGLTEWLGSHDETVRLANDAKHFPSLLSLGLVKYGPTEDESGALCYLITANGKKELEKAAKAAK